MGIKHPYYGKSMSINFPDFHRTMGFVAFSRTVGNWWKNPCISHMMTLIFFFFLSCESSGVILFFLLLCKFLFLPILKKLSSSFVVQDFNFYSNEYLHKNIHKYPSFLLSPRQNNVVWKFQNKSSSF